MIDGPLPAQSPGELVDIVCSVLNGARYFPELLASLRAQTYTAWRLWLRDDGSSDGTVELFRAAARDDARVHVLHEGGPRLGVAQSFGWCLERVPADSRYVLTADVDDVWLPAKLERTLHAMQTAERRDGASVPLLVHTDLTVVDDDLSVRHPSFWEYTGIIPEPATLRRLVVRNVATGPTVMINAALRARVGATPREALHHDWWYALVAAATGRLIALPESTVLYRQHDANDVGAQATEEITLERLPEIVRNGMTRRAQFRSGVAKTAAQARVLLERYAADLDADDRRFLSDYARMPERGLLRRKLDAARLRALPEHGLIGRIGALLRG